MTAPILARLADALHRGLLTLAARLGPWRTPPREPVEAGPVLHYYETTYDTAVCGVDAIEARERWTTCREHFDAAGSRRHEQCVIALQTRPRT